MSESDRSGPPQTGLKYVISGLALVIVLSAIGLGFYYQSKYENAATNRAADYAKHAEQQIGQTCFGIPVVEQPTCLKKARTETDLQTRDNQRNEADLVAQRTSALWTSIMGIAALFGMGLSAVGVYLVWTTFRATQEGNDIARDTAKRQLRAYVNVTNYQRVAYGVGNTSQSTVTITNKGQTPAHDVALHFYFGRQNLPLDPAMLVGAPLGREPSKSTLAADEPMESTIVAQTGPTTQTEFGAFVAGHLGYFAFGEVTYIDVFGDPHTTRFRAEMLADGRFAHCSDGNHSD